jgi:ABC-type bacteriocin/lantibiotic exporter with double-glycine peptidase domain
MPVSVAVPHHQQQLSYSCVAACARMALEFHGIIQSEPQLCVTLGTQAATGTPAANLSRLVTRISGNLRVEFGGYDLQDLETALLNNELPIVFLTGALSYGSVTGHAVVCCGVDALDVELKDPARAAAALKTSRNSFDTAWGSSGRLAVLIGHR